MCRSGAEVAPNDEFVAVHSEMRSRFTNRQIVRGFFFGFFLRAKGGSFSDVSAFGVGLSSQEPENETEESG